MQNDPVSAPTGVWLILSVNVVTSRVTYSLCGLSARASRLRKARNDRTRSEPACGVAIRISPAILARAARSLRSISDLMAPLASSPPMLCPMSTTRS
jgi:hypothetical protein